MQETGLHGLGGYMSILILAIILIVLAILIGAACHYIAKSLIRLTNRLFNKKKSNTQFIGLMFKYNLFQRIAYLVPAIIFYSYADLFDIRTKYLTIYLADAVRPLTTIYIMFGITFIMTALLNCIHDKYKNLAIANRKPIKSYLQAVKIILFFVTAILAASIVINKSPFYVTASLSAAAAVLLLIFKDSFLGFVASIQLAAYDMVHIGDSIEMSSFGVDGEVIDISLNTVKVQNSDKSIVAIPSYALLTSGMKNWRGMKEAGGRRIKRAINIDITTIKICNEVLLMKLLRLNILQDKLQARITEITEYNTTHAIDTSLLANGKQLTNVGIFRYYLECYLRTHPGIHKGMKILVRQLQATATGLPLELYAFANDTNQDRYEAIQADIVEHIYAVLPTFELRAFQYATSSNDSLPTELNNK